MGTQKLKKVPMGTLVPKWGPMWQQGEYERILRTYWGRFVLLNTCLFIGVGSFISPLGKSSCIQLLERCTFLSIIMRFLQHSFGLVTPLKVQNPPFEHGYGSKEQAGR